MQQIFNFFIKNVTFLLFLILFCISLALTIQSHSYHRSEFFNSANAISGSVYSAFSAVSNYFDLDVENKTLTEENLQLRERLYNLSTKTNTNHLEPLAYDDFYAITSAVVIKNSYRRVNNSITINKGLNDSINQDYGVITSKGIVGIIDNLSNNYSTVLSILSKKNRINALHKSTNHFGSLAWNGKSPNYTQLLDVSKFVGIKKGDTITTGGQSAIFPKGINIGVIDSFETDISGDTYIINVKLFNDMTTLDTVYIINHKDKPEIKALENSVDE